MGSHLNQDASVNGGAVQLVKEVDYPLFKSPLLCGAKDRGQAVDANGDLLLGGDQVAFSALAT